MGPIMSDYFTLSSAEIAPALQWVGFLLFRLPGLSEKRWPQFYRVYRA